MAIVISELDIALRAAIPADLMARLEIISATNGILITTDTPRRIISIWPNGECDVDDRDGVGRCVQFHHYEFPDIAGAVQVILREVELVLRRHA